MGNLSNVILYIAMSLDGFIARNDGDISWLQRYERSDEDYGFREFYNTVGAVVMGSRTYEKSLTLEGGIDTKMPTYVATSREFQEVAGADLTFYSGPLPELLETVRLKTDKNVWLVGGGLLAQSFFIEGLIDELILSLVPTILGDGLPLFGCVRKEIDGRLVKTKSYHTGIVQAHYVFHEWVRP